MEIKWIKLATNIFDDEKILLIEQLPDADGIIVIWFKLLTLAGKQNNNGVFMLNDRIPYTLEMLSAIFRRKIALVQLAIETFKNLGMIEIIDDVYKIPNWTKHQAFLDRNEYMKLYMKNRRDNQDVNQIVNTPVNIVNDKNKNKKENKKEKREEETNNNDNGLAETMEYDGRFDRLEKLIIYNFLPNKGKPLNYVEGNLVIDWLKTYPFDYIVEKITQCSLQPESKRSMAYLQGAMIKGYVEKGVPKAIDEQIEENLDKVFEELKELKKGKK
jgi:predicted phage replisome organizer